MGVNSPFNHIDGLQPSNEDSDEIECGEFVLENLGSARETGRIKEELDIEVRDQWTVEDVEDLHDKVKLAKMGPRRN